MESLHLNKTIESKQHLRPANPLHHISFPPLPSNRGKDILAASKSAVKSPNCGSAMDSNRKLPSIPESPRSIKTLMAGRLSITLHMVGLIVLLPPLEPVGTPKWHTSLVKRSSRGKSTTPRSLTGRTQKTKSSSCRRWSKRVETLEFVAAENAVHTNVLARVS